MPHRAASVQREGASRHRDERAGNPLRRVGGEEDRKALDVVGVAEPAGGDPAQELIAKLGRFSDPSFKPGIEHLCGKYRVDAHAMAGPLGAELACHLRYSAHRHAVSDVAAAERADTGERADIDEAAAAGGK